MHDKDKSQIFLAHLVRANKIVSQREFQFSEILKNLKIVNSIKTKNLLEKDLERIESRLDEAYQDERDIEKSQKDEEALLKSINSRIESLEMKFDVIQGRRTRLIAEIEKKLESLKNRASEVDAPPLRKLFLNKKIEKMKRTLKGI